MAMGGGKRHPSLDSLVSENLQGIHATGAVGWEITRHNSHTQKYHKGTDQRKRIEGIQQKMSMDFTGRTA